MKKKSVFIFGTGGFAREVASLIDENGEYDSFKGFIDLPEVVNENYEKQIMGRSVYSIEHFLADPENSIVIAIASATIREKVVNDLPKSTNYATLIHPSAIISKWAQIGEGSIVCAGCIVTVNIKIGAHAHLNLNTTIGHDCTIGNFFTTAPSVNISGECTFGEKVYMGTGAATRQGLTVASDITVGMGAMLVKSAIEPGVYVGIPAKLLKR